jgi:hypothetical protein
MAIKRIAKLTALSIVAWIAGILIAFGVAQIFPQRLVAPPPSPEIMELQKKLKTQGYLTEKEMQSVAKDREQIMRDLDARYASESFGELVTRIGVHALWLAWLPWAILALYAFNAPADLLPAAVMIALLLVTRLTLPVEAIVFGSVCVIAFFAKRILSTNRASSG